MDNVLKVLQTEKNNFVKVGGILLGAATVAGIGYLAYKKFISHKPKMVCSNCISDDDLSDFLEHFNDDEGYHSDDWLDYDESWGEYENE